jgi:hypothetical protein
MIFFVTVLRSLRPFVCQQRSAVRSCDADLPSTTLSADFLPLLDCTRAPLERCNVLREQGLLGLTVSLLSVSEVRLPALA